MKFAIPALALVALIAGCQGGIHRRYVDCSCQQDACCSEACPSGERQTVTCPGKAGPDIEVHVPRQKVVVEMPPQPAPATVQAPAAPCAPPAAPVQQAAPAMAPNMMPMGYGQGMMMPNMTAQAPQRARLGFMMDTIRIPIPFIRPIAVPQAPEMTMTMPMAAPAMMPMMAAQPVMPMATAMMPAAAAPAAMPMAATPTLMLALPAGGAAAAPQQSSMQMNISGSMSADVLALLMRLGAGNPNQLNMLFNAIAQNQITPQQAVAILQASQAQPAPTVGATGAAGASVPALSGAAPSGTVPVSLSGVGQTSSADALTTAKLQEQIRAAEQRLKELAALREGGQK
jgi:hypothetical protein